MFCNSGISIFVFPESNYSIYAHTMLIKTSLLHQSFGHRVLLSLSLSLRLFLWSTEARCVHFPARASKTLLRRRFAPSPHREGAWGLRKQSMPSAGALLASCVNQGISASFSLLYFLIGRLRTTRFRCIKGPQQSMVSQRVGHNWVCMCACTHTHTCLYLKVQKVWSINNKSLKSYLVSLFCTH